MRGVFWAPAFLVTACMAPADEPPRASNEVVPHTNDSTRTNPYETAPKPDPQAALEAPSGRATDKASAARRIVTAPAEWSVDLAYDLGDLQLAVFSKDDESVTAVRARPPAAQAPEAFDKAFAGAAFDGAAHPLEVLGYELVQPSGHGTIGRGPSARTWLRFGWLRQEPGEPLERGSGSAYRLACPGPDVVVVAGEAVDGYDPSTVETFATAAECPKS